MKRPSSSLEEGSSSERDLLSQLDSIRSSLTRAQPTQSVPFYGPQGDNLSALSSEGSASLSISVAGLLQHSHLNDLTAPLLNPTFLSQIQSLSQMQGTDPSAFNPFESLSHEVKEKEDRARLEKQWGEQMVNEKKEREKREKLQEEDEERKKEEVNKVKLHEDYFKTFEDELLSFQTLAEMKAADLKPKYDSATGTNVPSNPLHPGLKTPAAYSLPSIGKVGDTSQPTVEYIHNAKIQRSTRQGYVDKIFPLLVELFGGKEMGRRCALLLEMEIYAIAEGEAGYRHVFAYKIAKVKEQLRSDPTSSVSTSQTSKTKEKQS